MTEYHDKFDSFEYELINHEKVSELIYFIINTGLKTYTNFDKEKWKNGYFYHYKNEKFEIWCTAYNGGRMSFIVEYLKMKTIINVNNKDIPYSEKNIAMYYFIVPDFDNDKEIIQKNLDYYFKLICNNINDSLNKNKDNLKKIKHYKLPFNSKFDEHYLHLIMDNGKLFDDIFLCDNINIKNISEVYSIINDLFYIKHYLDNID